jgi:hypothetical protein
VDTGFRKRSCSIKKLDVAAKPQARFISSAASAVNDPLTKITKSPLFLNGFDKVRPNLRRYLARFYRQHELIRERLRPRMTTMSELIGRAGFTSPIAEKTLSRRRNLGVELIATTALAVCLIIAVTAVSIGMARAQALATVGGDDRAPFAIGLFLGAVMAGMGGLTAIAVGDRQTPRD